MSMSLNLGTDFLDYRDVVVLQLTLGLLELQAGTLD